MMHTIKRTFLRIFLCTEVIVFAGIYLYGSYGVRTLTQLHEENSIIEQSVNKLQSQVAVLEQELSDWNTHSFHKEKVAREQLQMAREGDTIFYIS